METTTCAPLTPAVGVSAHRAPDVKSGSALSRVRFPNRQGKPGGQQPSRHGLAHQSDAKKCEVGFHATNFPFKSSAMNARMTSCMLLSAVNPSRRPLADLKAAGHP